MRLTEEEFEDAYGEVLVKFRSYYKYSFLFEGTTPEGHSIRCSCGGDVSDIYRFEVSADKLVSVNSLSLTWGEVRNGEEKIAEFSSW